MSCDTKTGEVSRIKILGKNDNVECDAVVVCAGAATQSLLKTLLGVRTPILPLKTYTYDIPNAPEQSDSFALVFDNANFTAVAHGDSQVRVQMAGDLVGYDTSYDKKRIRNTLNRVAKTLDVSDVMKHQNLSANLVGISPDDLPVVGHLKHHPNVFVNAGHGIRASSLAFVTGQHLSDQINKGEQSKFAPSRFNL